MSTITIPKKMASKDDLIIVPRKEYEALVELKKIREFTPTPAEKHALERARKNRVEGKVMSIHELKRKLGFGN
jgi:hypothetical protein